MLEGELGRRPTAAVEPVELAGLGIPYDGKEVAANAAAGGLDQAEHRIGGNGCIDRGATALEDVDGHLGGQGLRCRDHTVLAQDFRAGGKRMTGNAIAGVARPGQSEQGK